MKIKSFVLMCMMSAVSAFAGKIVDYEGMMFVDGEMIPYKQAEYFAELSFENDEPYWDKGRTRNFENKVVIAFGAEKLGRKCLLLTQAAPGEKKIDTAWEIASKRQEYKGNAGSLVLDYDIASSLNFALMNILWGYGTQICWYDKDNKSLGVQKIRLNAMDGRYSVVRYEGLVPEGAASYDVTIGFDSPNFDPEDFLAISQLRIGRIPENALYVRECWMSTATINLYDTNDISWRAECPTGTRLSMQVSEAPDVNGLPGKWSDFHGPDGTAASYYTTAFKSTHPWIKLKIFFFSSDGKVLPTLKSITVNGVEDCNWRPVDRDWEPVIENLTVSPTRNRREPIVLRVTCEDAILWKTFRAELDGQDVTRIFTRSGNVFTGKPEADYADGLHVLKVKIDSANGMKTDSIKYLMLGENPPVDKITLRDDGMTLINGEPFFPIGPYSVWKREVNNNNFDKAFADLKAGGFNFAHTYGGGEELKEFMDTAQKYGFRLWIWASVPFDKQFWNITFKHPAILAWYIGDDTSASLTPAKLQDRHDALKAVDDMRITTQADGVISNQAKANYMSFVSGSDNFLPEIYPMRQAENAEQAVPAVINDMKSVMKSIDASGRPHPKSVWPIIQYFDGWGWNHFPTDDELRAMSYAAIIHGATGITWYTYGGYYDARNNRYNHGITSTPERWKCITGVATEINSLTPVLTERKPADQPQLPTILSGPRTDAMNMPSVTCLMKRHDGDTYVLAVNSAMKEVKAKINLQDIAGGQVLFENRQAPVKDGAIVDVFKPYAVHVYKLK